MSPELIGWLGLLAMIILLILRVPVAFTLAMVGFFGYAAVSGFKPALKVIGMVPYTAIATYGFSVVPLFLIMGHFASRTGLMTDLFHMARLWVGKIPGGLVQATIIAGSAFGAASGSGLAATSVLASVCIPEMRQGGVEKKLACGTVASVGPIDQMIPPSILMVIYCIITGASFGAFILAVVGKGQTWSQIGESLLEAARVTGMIFLIIAGAFIFGYFLTITRIPTMVSEFITGLPVSPLGILIGVMILYLIIGMFVDMVAALFVTLPVIFPAMVKLGFDPIWFGVLIVMQCEIALISPPFGLSLFIVKGIVKDITLEEVIRGIVPFFIIDLIVLALYITFP